MGEWARARWTSRWRCWISFHDWYYYGYERTTDWHRDCTRCGRRERASYDMGYGETTWEKARN